MIGTLSKRVILVGDYTDWNNQWMFLDDDKNNNLTWNEMKGISKVEKKHLREGTIDKFSKVVDTSEFVVRFSKLRTQVGGNSEGLGQFGRKVDALVINGKTLISMDGEYSGEKELLNSIKENSNPNLLWSENIFDLFVSIGIIPFNYRNTGNVSTVFKEKRERYKDSSILREDKTRLYRLLANKIQSDSMVSEVWINTAPFMNQIVRKMYGHSSSVIGTPNFKERDNAIPLFMDEHDITGFEKEICLDLIEKFNVGMERYIEVYNTNIKIHELVSFLRLRENIKKQWISFDEMESLYGHKLWWKELIYKQSEKTVPKKYGFNSIIEGSNRNMMMNRGLLAIDMVLNDDRFKDYDKYIIGYFGIDQSFAHGPEINSQMIEYRYISNLIKNGVVKYLPEHIDSLNESLDDSLNNNIIPLNFNAS